MIDYFKGIYGTNLLLRVHGSALYKGMLVGFLSTLIYLAIELVWNKRSRRHTTTSNSTHRLPTNDDTSFESLIPDLEDPYGAGVLISGVTFLIIFRANSGYQRYWEAVSSLHQCMGKWMDATMCAASFHLQCAHYDGARPHNFYEFDDLDRLNLTLERRRTSGVTTTTAATTNATTGACVGAGQDSTTTKATTNHRSAMGGQHGPSGIRKRSNASTAGATTTNNRLTSAYDCEKEFSGDGNIFVGSKIVENTSTDDRGGGDAGGGGGLLSTSLSWRRTSSLTSSQPGRNTSDSDGKSRIDALQQQQRQQLQRSWRRSFTSSTIPLFGSNNSSRSIAPTPLLVLPNSVLEGEWNIIPPTPYTTSPDMFHRTQLHSRYFPSSQYRHDANFAHRPPTMDLPGGGGGVQQQHQRQQRRHHADRSNPTTTATTTTPPLFLQELAHLSSLACAVALSTLRNDMERGESPLGIYIPGAPWPEIDPDNLPKHVLHEFQPKNKLLALGMHWLGLDRLPRYRSKYNATRPLLILGGVSDAEIAFLQRARGPYAKVELANSWLKEFIIRESLAGSCGNVHPSIVSRVVQHLSDGMMGYNMARYVVAVDFELGSISGLVCVVARIVY